MDISQQNKLIKSARIILANYKQYKHYKNAKGLDNEAMEDSLKLASNHLLAMNSEIKTTPWRSIEQVQQFMKALRRKR